MSRTEALGYAVTSLGCKVSRIDALAWGASLERSGWKRVDEAQADVIVVQTCTVTGRADRDGRKLIRSLARENPLAAVVATGCLAERDAALLAAMPEVALIVGHGVAAELPALLAARESGFLAGKVVHAGEPSEMRSPLHVALEPDRTRAFVKVQDGCERRCAFCIVPQVRGRERSAFVSDVAGAVRRLGEDGVPEAVIAGIHLASFGAERGESLLDLLDELEAEPPRCRVRVSSLEPMEAGSELVTRLARSRVVVPHLHLPLQSGSERVLRRMRRGILPSRYAALARAAADANPRLHLATDVIAGFPGETDEEFEETLRFLAELPFASLHVFPFSPRSGTRAAELHAASPVPRAVVAERARRLRALAEEKSAEFAARNAGTEAEVVVLAGARALTDNYLDVPLDPPDAAPRGARLLARLAGPPDALRAVAVYSAGTPA